MAYFTLDEVSPKESTLNFIRQVAYTCRYTMSANGRRQIYSLN